MTRREIICGSRYRDAAMVAELQGLREDEWDWCSGCSEGAELNYPSEENYD